MASEDVADDEQNLETLLAKATNPLHRQPDPESVSAFCEFVEKERDGPQTALRLLAHKIQSPIEKESLMALAVLEASVKTCGTKFKSEVGKFRFLNEMIKVVSPKYLGNRASPKVKQKIIELMYLWSIELKQETKIFEAYQMLRRQGVVIEDPVYVIEDYVPPPPPAPRPKNAIFDDEEKAKQLQQLLSSNRPEDLQAANRMIKNMVKEADRRMELLAKRSTELETVHNNAKVLADMLDHYSASSTSTEEKELMKELFESCERLRPKLFRLAGEMDEKDEGLCDILKANDELTIVISRYRKIMGISETSDNSLMQSTVSDKNSTTLLDLASPVQPSASPPSDSSLLDDQLLVLGLNDPVDLKKPSSSSNASSGPLSDLDQIFAIGDSSKSLQSHPVFSRLPPLSTNTTSSLPISIPSSAIESSFKSAIPLTSNYTDVSLKPQTYVSGLNANPNPPTKNSSSLLASKGFEELDELGQSLLRKSMPSASSSKIEIPSTPQKIPLSQMKQKKEQEIQLQSSSLPSSSVVTEGKSVDVISACSNPALNSVFSERTPTPQSPVHEVLSLADVFVPLETIQPGSLQPLTLLEKNGLTVVIHFGVNSPRPDVSVMVVSTMSKNSSPVKSVSFQAAVPKAMKIKLQPPSATDLPPHNPILPPAAITQVLLLANPQKEKVRFKYKVNYSLNNKDYTEIGEVDDLFSAR